MKSNIVKYIFVAIVIGLVIFSAVILYGNKDEENQKLPIAQTEEIKMITNMRVPIVNFDTINPILSKNQNIQDLARLIYEPLLNINENYKIEMCLAKEYSKVSPTSYVIKLKENIKWQDGKILTAKDLQFTIDILKNSKVNSIYAWNVKDVSGVEVIDDTTIRINLNKEVPFFEYNLIFPIMSQYYYENEDFLTTAKNNNPVGTGRFKVINNNGNISLKQNQNWWNLENDKTKLTEIQFIKYANMGEVYNAFKTGNIDLLNTETLNLEEYIGTLGYTAKEYYGRELDFIAFNCNNKVVANLEVRKAINTAIDKQNIISAIYADKYFISHFPLDFGCYLYPKGKVTIETNQDKAKAFLVNAGWEYKSKTWKKTIDYKTQRIELDLVVKNSNIQRVQVAENIKAQLEAIGIKITIIKASDSQYQKYLENKNYDLILTGVYSSYSPDLTTYFGNDNLANFHTEEINTIMQEINTITDEKLLQEKYDKLIQVYTEQVPYICLYYNRNTLVCSPKLVGDIQPYSYNMYRNIESWYRQ